jgi:hypothetical protein
MPFLGTLVLPRSEYKRKRNDRKEKKRKETGAMIYLG